MIKHTKPNTQAYTIQDRAGKPGGGKGMLIQTERTGTLGTSCGSDRTLVVIKEKSDDGTTLSAIKQSE